MNIQPNGPLLRSIRTAEALRSLNSGNIEGTITQSKQIETVPAFKNSANSWLIYGLIIVAGYVIYRIHKTNEEKRANKYAVKND